MKIELVKQNFQKFEDLKNVHFFVFKTLLRLVENILKICKFFDMQYI